MIFSIFNAILKKFIENKKGAIEYIESAIVFPILVVFISFLFIISFMVIQRAMAFESIYKNSRIIANNTDDDFEIIKNVDKTFLKEVETNQNKRLKRLNQDEINIIVNEGLMNNTISNVKNKNIYIRTKKIYPVDMSRKIDFLKIVFDDIKDINIHGYSITEVFNSISSLADRFKEKIK